MKKVVRKCSHCKRQGHTKRTCGESLRSTAKKAVPIFVSSKKTLSRHVVDLGKKEEKKMWPTVPVYTEKKREKIRRSTVNFAELVRQDREARKETQEEGMILESVSDIGRKEKKDALSEQDRIPQETVLKKQRHVPTIRFPRISLPSFSFPRLHFPKFVLPRLVPSLAILGILLVLPFPAKAFLAKVRGDSNRVVEESTDAFLSLQSSTLAALHANLPQAEHDLNLALGSFSNASNIIDKEYGALVFIARALPFVGPHIASRQHILEAGHNVALGNTYLIKGIQSASIETGALTDRLLTVERHLRSAIPSYKSALDELSAVETNTLPAEYQQTFEEFRLLYAAYVNDLSDTAELIQMVQSLAGDESLKSYLIVGQNPDELRATGGFMGSFAILHLQKGRVTRLEIPEGGAYDLQGQLKTYVKPPVPLQVVNKRWEFQDANWFPAFPESAQKVEWFYQKAWGESFDGVIAVNASVLPRLLGILGGVALENRDLFLTEEDALASLRTTIEDDNATGEKPKAVLGETVRALASSFDSLDTTQGLQILTEFLGALRSKDIQIYLHDTVMQAKIAEYGWSGDILASEKKQDYLMVVATNIGGGKSDARMHQEISHEVTVHADGTADVTLLIRRTHTGSESELFYGAANMSYIRAYVPKGAELLGAEGFTFPPEEAFLAPEEWYEEDEDLSRLEKEVGIEEESGTRVSEEFGKTVFGNWMATPPGETSEAYLVYRLPFTLFHSAPQGQDVRVLLVGKPRESSRYSLVAQKQSGIESDFISTIIYPDGWHPAWRTSNALDLAENGAVFSERLDRDRVFGFVMEK